MTGFRITTTSTQPAIANAGEFWVGPLWTYDIAPPNNMIDRELTISSECTITAPVTCSGCDRTCTSAASDRSSGCGARGGRSRRHWPP
jgi:hypothetical protein